MYETVEERINAVSVMFQKLLESKDDYNGLMEILDTGHPAVALNAVRLVSNVSSVGYRLQGRQKSHSQFGKTVGVKDVDCENDLLVATADALMQYYVKSNKPEVRNVFKYLEKMRYKEKVSMAAKLSYSSAIADKTDNKYVAIPLMPYKTSQLGDMFERVTKPLVGQLNDLMDESNLSERYQEVALKELRPYIGKWNASNPIMPLREKIAVTLPYHMGYVKVELTNTNGKKFSHSDRHANHWLIDGLFAYPYIDFESHLKLDEWSIALTSPSVWINLDNYHRLDGNGLSIEEVATEMLGGTEDLKALSIGLPETPIYKRKLIFFKKQGDSYVPVNTNRKEANLTVKRMELIKKMTQE